jgi:hypothetical protein
MTKSRKRPTRIKPPIQPRREDQYGTAEVSEEQQRWIGLVIINWSKIEQNIEDVIWSFLGLDLEAGRLVTARLNAEMKINLLSALSRTYLAGELLEDALECINFINGYKEDRNFIAHGSWHTLMPENVPACASLRTQSPTPNEVVTETFPNSRMRAIIDGMLEAISNLRLLRNVLETSRNTQQSPPLPH